MRERGGAVGRAVARAGVVEALRGVRRRRGHYHKRRCVRTPSSARACARAAERLGEAICDDGSGDARRAELAPCNHEQQHARERQCPCSAADADARANRGAARAVFLRDRCGLCRVRCSLECKRPRLSTACCRHQRTSSYALHGGAGAHASMAAVQRAIVAASMSALSHRLIRCSSAFVRKLSRSMAEPHAAANDSQAAATAQSAVILHAHPTVTRPPTATTLRRRRTAHSRCAGSTSS